MDSYSRLHIKESCKVLQIGAESYKIKKKAGKALYLEEVEHST